MEQVVVVEACRTAIGTFGGSLKDVPPADLGATVIRGVLDRSGLEANQVGHVVMGQVIHTEARDMYLSRVAAVQAGIPFATPAFNVNRLCGSGLQAIVSSAQAIMVGDTTIAIAAGAESMSRAPYISSSHRWGARMGDSVLVDMMTGALADPFDKIHMGVTAENVARKFSISREAQDALALESQLRAENAIKNGLFAGQIVPVLRKTRKGEDVFNVDEHVRFGATAESLKSLSPIFIKENGTVTAGNASGLNDAAAAVLLMSATEAEKRGFTPMARLVAYAHAGVDPKYMGIGPVPAVRAALIRAQLDLNDIDVIEANEAFAAQACAVNQELGLDPGKVNVNGSGISLGHPIGATGCVITVKALHELKRIGGRHALVTMCIGGGQGIAAIFERVA
ncbi:acetyl-CoA C-acyltransferase family protein [Paenalcaligenes niemegkensis]|uniref:acetyl-CoA C-acyltransferase family protein n=1 Tax=Paenalcaligenes niemegkensis TaxID=2895469 RepID=UPI001EE89552|nr:acetyl-CoA C-acyltransferase family protein [Paenalcaligenes niemegkensis]MCQ9616262.1 acetyl-CoA C-acyltransferase family protein [Paenalcaligenes niemegkensis]